MSALIAPPLKARFITLQLCANYTVPQPNASNIILPLVERPPEAIARVVEPELLVDAVDRLHVRGLELEIPFEIALDPRGGLALGQHRVAVGDSPCLGVLLAGTGLDWRAAWIMDWGASRS